MLASQNHSMYFVKYFEISCCKILNMVIQWSWRQRGQEGREVIWNVNANLTWLLLNTYYVIGTTERVFHGLFHLIVNSYEVSNLLMSSKVEKSRNTEIEWLFQGLYN